jgi:pimeloyl-ACP methyl ester carboxylesterase
MEALSARHTVYAADMFGFGGSVSDAPEITIATQVEAVLALLEAESIPLIDLIGNSVGGWVAATSRRSRISRR